MSNLDVAASSSSQGDDPFGALPGRDPLSGYAVDSVAADIFCSAPDAAAASWRSFAGGLASQSHGNLATLQPFMDRAAGDLGLAFRMAGDEQERAWPLNPMPIFIDAAEWESIGEALIQRADLLEAIIADIYGPQQLVADGHLPPTVVSGSRHFARRMVGSKPTGGHFLRVLAFDLARGPTGDWLVMADRVRMPVGLGYALENRMALARATGGLLNAVGTRPQARFFEALRNGIAASCARADPRIALLTPGRFNQTYPEQAHLARHLGFSLVEGRDLTVSDGKLYVRTIAGLKRIDALWRWMSTLHLDPLSFDTRSNIGVPNLVSAAEQGLALINWPGVGVVESRAMPALLPRLAKVMLGTPLKLPNTATWWCAGEGERQYVLDHMRKLVICSAFRENVVGLPGGKTRVGSTLSEEDITALAHGIAQRPMDYVAQQIIALSSAPALIDGAFAPRAFTVRAFLARDEAGNWVVLDGGFARIAQHGNLHTSLMGLGDISTDLCIVDTALPVQQPAPLHLNSPAPRREQGLLPSQVADNLFWIGRYGERAHQTVRIIRTLLEQASVSGTRVEARGAVTRLANLLRNLDAAPPESRGWQPSRLAAFALSNLSRPGTVRSNARSARQIALLLRDRLTRDSWRAMTRPFPQFTVGDLDGMMAACDQLVERFASLARLTYDGMSRGPAWLFLDMGLCLERGSMILQSVQAMADQRSTPEELAALLDLVDGQATYRSRYLSSPALAPVLDLVLLDPAQPRGLACQLARIEEHLGNLPVQMKNGMVEPPLRHARQMRVLVEGMDARSLSPLDVGGLQREIAQTSDLISAHYFLQEKAPSPPAAAAFLA